MPQANNPRCFASLNMTEERHFNSEGIREQALQHSQRITSTSSSVPGTGIARNRNYPAYKNLRKTEADPAGARRFSEILSGADHFRKDASQLFRAVYSITVPAALCILPKGVCSVQSKPRYRAPPKTE